MENEFDDLVFDLNAIMSFVIGNDNVKNSEITEMYGVNDEGALTLLNKQINENKASKSDSNTTIRYDMVKMMLGIFYDVDEDYLTVSQRMIYNTFLKQGFIKKKD